MRSLDMIRAMEATTPFRTLFQFGGSHLAESVSTPPGWWSALDVLKGLGRPGPRRVVAAWLVSVLVSMASGIAVVAFDLSAIPIPLGFVTVDLTIYPPILIGTLLLLWLGPEWAIAATYLAQFALGTYAGLGIGANLLFSLADTVQLLVIWGGLMVLEVPFEIENRNDRIYFLSLVLTGSVASSLGALVWNYSRHLDFHQGFHIWQGWVVGAFLQGGLLVLLIHRLAGRRARSWLESNLELQERHSLGPRGGAVLMLSSLLLVAAIAAQVGRGFAASVAQSPDPEAELVSRLPELGLFVLLILAAMVGATSIFTVALTRRSERERYLARVDELTGCLNRFAFTEVFAREAARCKRLGLPISTVFLDIDHFKSINDDYDYATGDVVLSELSSRINGIVRDTDYLFRWGGEEFVLLLPHTSEREAELLAERVREAIRSDPFTCHGLEFGVTASFGVSGAEHPESWSRDMLNRAAQACRRAKRNGRDRVETTPWPSDSETPA